MCYNYVGNSKVVVMKKNLMIIACVFVLIGVCGCQKEDNTNTSTKENDVVLSKLLTKIENNSKLIEELSIKNEELNNQNKELLEKIKTLEENKKTVDESIEKLENEDKTVKTKIDNNYNDLKNLINNKPSGNINQYTITKDQLLGTWGYDNNSLTFLDNNTEVIENWIIWKGMTIHYMYKDGKLYTSDDGVIMSKQ